MRVDLKLNKNFKFFCILLAAIAGSFAFVGISTFFEAKVTFNWLNLILGIIATTFFGVMFLVLVRRITCENGSIEIRPDKFLVSGHGLGPFSGFLRENIIVGMAPWDQIIKLEETRAQGFCCLGISVSEPAEFLSLKEQNEENPQRKNIRLGDRLARIWFFISSKGPLRPITLLFLKIFGFSGLPNSLSEQDLMEWNKTNYGHHILIPAFIIPNGIEAVLESVKQHNSTKQPESEESKEVPQASHRPHE